MFRTPYNGKIKISAEDYSKVKSITEPEQVLPLQRIISGLKTGAILLPTTPQHFDIPEHEVDYQQSSTPEGTNAAIHEAQLNDLSATADKAGTDITAAPGFQPEDAHAFTGAVEKALSEAAIKTGAVGELGDNGAAAKQKGDVGADSGSVGKSSASGEGNAASTAQ